MILDYILNILLIALIIFQFIVLSYLLYTTHKKYKNDLKFWKKQNEISEEFLLQLKTQTNDIINEKGYNIGPEDRNKK